MYKKFREIEVSTQTFIVRTDIEHVHLNRCLNTIVERDHPRIRNVRYGGRAYTRRSDGSPHDKTDIGSVAAVGDENCDEVEEFDEINSKINTRKRTFLNCITLAIFARTKRHGVTNTKLKDRSVNVKIFHNGVFQLTGCRSLTNARSALNILFDVIRRRDEPPIVYYVESAMRNVDFKLGFAIDRIRFGNYVEKHTPYTVPPMTSGYMGVKIRIAINDVEHIPVLRCTYPNDHRSEYVSYGNLFRDVFPRNFGVDKRFRKKRFVSMSIFQNGKVLMSGMHACVQEPCYEWFVRFVASIRDKVDARPVTKRSFKRPRISSTKKRYGIVDRSAIAP